MSLFSLMVNSHFSEKNALISIITPNWNGASYIAETIQAIKQQSYSHWEMIIIDDASTDNSIEVIQAEINNDPRITLLQNDQNKGQCYSRNRGLDACQGTYITFIDADDLILPDKFRDQLAFMDENNYPLTYAGYRRMTADGQTIGHLIKGPKRLDYGTLLRNTAMGTLTPMVHRDVIGTVRFDESLTAHEDFCFWLDIFRQGHQAIFFDQDTARYRRGYASVSSDIKKGALYMWWILRNREKLSLVTASWSFVNYAIRAAIKRFKF